MQRRMDMKKHFILSFLAIGILFMATGISAGQEKSVDLNAEYDLSLREASGDVNYFKMRTVYYHGNSMGITQSREELITTFKREAVKIE